jgi:hypothetical protein
LLRDPQFSGFFSTGRTRFAFARMTNAFNVRATWRRTTIFMITANDVSATEKFGDANNNGGPEFGFMLLIKAPPILISGENLFESDFLCHHKNMSAGYRSSKEPQCAQHPMEVKS